MNFDGLADGWDVWSVENRRAVLAYRPDIFDSSAFPAECLPTIYLTKGRRGRRPGRPTPPPDAPWFVTLYLEPDVSQEFQYDGQDAAIDGAKTLAAEFATGEFAYRELYQLPRERYLDKLDELTGQDSLTE